ncbi:putative hydro-lyase [Reyranella sp. CPCC 100927]|uniref:putative hydro-lyase n=1 Tax=Reyranella sp. CPCC 100927 TaxID=2599616 RepID=UPI0011B5C418|nr:putative hydro-lyase [Reyranella sp. CPCC 100927]TWT02844.1 putative hydro-lyase [Reyranella sp. CPCC 100927]
MNSPHPVGETGQQARLRIRRGQWRAPTAYMAPGYVQANLAILPAEFASDFLRFCHRNPKSCPLLDVSEPGDPFVPRLGQDLDIRTDLPLYRVWENGELVEEVPDIKRHWRDGLVSFLLGCSFSFEDALVQDGIALRHIVDSTDLPAYRTSIPTVSSGPFHGPMVVSMRLLKPADAIRAIQITSRFPNVHGAPVHIGLPGQIGIADLAKPDWGGPVNARDDELPVFWACGVTPQTVIMESKLPFCITHSPAHMLITDLLNTRLAII